MTNIRTKNIFPEELDDIHQYPNRDSLELLLNLRRATYVGFALVEEEKGLLTPSMSLSTPKGQEAVRILMQRGFEELVEAYDSLDRDHVLEELIDALNYFLVLAIIDPLSPDLGIINGILDGIFQETDLYGQYYFPTPEDLGNLMIEASPFMESLRHRAWMNNAQSTTFEGWIPLTDFLKKVFIYISKFFHSYTEFVQFFIAKDRVLQFRLSTKY